MRKILPKPELGLRALLNEVDSKVSSTAVKHTGLNLINPGVGLLLKTNPEAEKVLMKPALSSYLGQKAIASGLSKKRFFFPEGSLINLTASNQAGQKVSRQPFFSTKFNNFETTLNMNFKIRDQYSNPIDQVIN